MKRILLVLASALGALPLMATLRITEMCPRPDAPDPNDKEAGWIELQNTGDTEITLSDYALIRFNRGKKEKNSLEDDLKPFPKELGTLAPGARIVIYTGEEYDNIDNEAFTCYPVGETDERIAVFPFKVNPKKYPTVRLYKVDPADEAHTLLQTMIVPVDLEDNKSFGPASAVITVPIVTNETAYAYTVTNGDETIEGIGTGSFAVLEDVPATYTQGNAIQSLVAMNGTTVATAVKEADGVYNFADVTSAQDGLRATLTEGTTLDGGFAASFWFKTTQSPVENGNIDGKGMVLFECRPSPSDDGTNNRAGINLFIDGNGILRIQPRNQGNGSSNISTEGTNVTDNEWHHVVLTGGMKPGETVTLYYDGDEAISAKLAHDITLQLAYLCYGRAYNSNSWLPYIGELKNIQFFPRVLTAEEVQAESVLLSDVTSLTATGVTASETADDEYVFGKSEASTLAYLEDGNTTQFGGETVAFWVKPTSFDGAGNEATVLMDCRADSHNLMGYLLLRKNDGTLYVQRKGDSGVVNVEYATDDLPLNEWTHVAFTLNPETTVGTLYINGVKVEGKTIDNYLDTTTKRRFGGSHDKYWRGLIGSMADVRVFNTVLSDLDIARLHNANERKQSSVTVDGTSLTVDTIVNVDSIAENATVSGTYTVTLAQAGKVTVTSEKEGLTITWNGVEQSLNTAFEVETGEYILTWTAPALNGDISLTATHAYANPDIAVKRFIFPTMTKGAENDYTGAIPVGPQVGPKLGKKADGTPALMGATPTKPVAAATDLPITFTIYPLSDNGDVAEENAITGVELLYVMDFGEVKSLSMTGDDETWTATIPGSELPEAGHLIRYAARITDGAGNVWRSPSENNLDDCPSWYGTIVEPTADQNSATLQTFHLFADAFALNNMDKQFDTIEGSYPYGARVGIYDMQTKEYYDRVRIDLRGNTSATFYKKSHGLRFNKCHPLIFDHPFDGFEIETRKTSFTAEWPDPTYLRQSLSFYIWRNAGNLVPFHYPVRLLRNGEFYQLAFHTNRFTDELIEDYYGLDPMGYGYKNVGPFDANRLTTSAGLIEKKTPDDGIETGTVAMAPLQTFVNRFKSVDASTEDDTAITKVVVQHFDLPAWFNYLATARITQEADDVWANISAYYDINGTNTWMPLAYDHNLSFGQWYYNDDRDAGKIGLRPNDDTFKSHPFYGGHRICAHKKSGATVGRPNYAVEAVWQSSKFRRLYLRRLRTLMDEVLKEPGTTAENTPFWSYMTTMQAAMTEDAATDRAKWGYGDSTQIYVWNKTMPLEEGIKDMWDNYVVPRRVHLFETHSATNTTTEIGYGAKLNAGIPAPQSAIADLKAGITLKTKLAELDDVLVIQNTNAEAVDMSNWTLAGAVEWTLPPGTVIDAQIDGVPGELYIVADRDTYVTANEAELTDQVIVGNADFTESQVFTLTATDGTVVITTEPSDAMLGLRVAEVMPATPDKGGDGAEYIILKNILTDKTINLEGVNVRAMKDDDSEPWKVDITLPAGTLEPGATCRLDKANFEESGWGKITNGKVRFEIRDAEGALCQYAYWSDKWYPQMDEGGASLIAVSFESEIGIGDDGKLDWKPSFVWPTDNEAAQAAITDAILANDAIATWLRTLDEAGNEALASFTGTAADLELCWLINLPPVAKPAVEMTITDIAFDADGNVQIDGSLIVGETEHTEHKTSVNGSIKVLKYTTLGGTPTEKALTTKTFPLEVTIAPEEAQFFKLKVE